MEDRADAGPSGAPADQNWAAPQPGAPMRERISFVPHPLTVTAAGDYEYFAAQGRHPFVYALAEFVDNSLRATRRNAPRTRAVTVSLVVSGSCPATARGLVSIHDNGCGMNKQELNAWAVMNYSMEERGLALQEPEAPGRGCGAAGAGCYLNGDISFFGVGSKNAGFFMGSSVKLTTKRADEAAVHELCLLGQELEQRYRNQEDVYVEDMVHRAPGDPSTLAAMEQPFTVAREWVATEVTEACQAAKGAGATSTHSFTRVVVGDLKPDVLKEIMDDEQGQAICQELAHLYHYYLHGDQGNRAGVDGSNAREGRLPNGEPLPDITVELRIDARLVWSRRLADIDDDMETKLLRAQRAELPFVLQVPDKGAVTGMLFYYPFENGNETVPVERNAFFKPREDSPLVSRAAAGLTQLPLQSQGPARGTQAPPRGTQAPSRLQPGAAELLGEEDDEESRQGWHVLPIFEAFWQGRLIPGARIDSLPFIEAVRQKRTAQTKDVIPDEAFGRLRGILFFGPGFKVTRNKLVFRDNVQQLLMTSAMPTERQMEAKFRQWLQRCHSSLDKSVRFEGLMDSRAQAAVRAELGEGTTAFERVSEGERAVGRGDVVRVNAKPQVVGRVMHFTIPQAVKEEGCYANGRVCVELLPAELHGLGCEKAYSLRRIEAVLSEAEVQEHVAKELLKVASGLRLEPMRFASGMEVVAGESIPETTLMVLNGAGKGMTKAALNSERLVVTQRLWRLPPAPAPATGKASEEASPPPAKRVRKGRKGRTKQDENMPPASDGAADAEVGKASNNGISLEGAELLAEFVNKTPDHECFKFKRLGGDYLRQAGRYVVEYVAMPAPPCQEPLRAAVELAVRAGKAVSLEVSGEGKVAASLRPFALGEALPPLKVAFNDAFGNAVALQPGLTPPSVTIQAVVLGADGSLQPCHELEVSVQQQVADDALVLSRLQLLGTAEAALADDGLQLFKAAGSSLPSARQAQSRPSQEAVPVAEVQLHVSLQGCELEPQPFLVQLRPGAPRSLRLRPGHPWGDASNDVVSLQHKQVLPNFSVQAYDAWGCLTGPSEHLPFQLAVECPSLAPASKHFEFSPLGVAEVSGLSGRVATQEGTAAELVLRIAPACSTPGAEAAFEAAGPLENLMVQVAVKPSAEPTGLGVLRDGKQLQTKNEKDSDGHDVAVLEGVPAGEHVTGLELVLLDESGVLARQPTPGRISVSWRNGSPRRNWEGQPLKLPTKLAASEHVRDAKFEWVRFIPEEGPTLELCLEIKAVPGEPALWNMIFVEQAASQGPEDRCHVQCGQPFAMELEALDQYQNRCGKEVALPKPVVRPESEAHLQWDEAEWEHGGWATQGNEQAYSLRMVLSGHPGPVKLTVSSAPDDPLQLRPDSMVLSLQAGAPAALCIEGLASLDCGTRAVIPQLRVCVCDSSGNTTTCSEALDVAINSAALASDSSGRAAAVSVNGGNKAKMKKGAAVFKDVRVTAEEAGSYVLRVQASSRKMALADAVLHIVMAPQNSITDLRVVVPPGLAEGVQAGSSAEMHVAVATQDSQPLDGEVARSSLALRVTPPSGSRANSVVYRLTASEERDGLLTEDGYFTFQLAELTAAGVYSAVAEYTEFREELLSGMSKKDATLRSSSTQFAVRAGPPVTAVLSAGTSALPECITTTNGPDQRQRRLLRSVAVQLHDAHGNDADQAAGVQLRFGLRAAAGAEGQAPSLQMVEGLGQWETDAQGRAFVGDLCITEGSGQAPAGTLECELVCEALGLYPCSAFAHDIDEEGWASCWRCPVLFSDDATRFVALQQLTQRREELVGRRNQLSERLSAARTALAEAEQHQQRTAQATEARRQAAPEPLPDTIKSAAMKLEHLRRQAEAQAQAELPPPAPAKYGRARHAMTNALDKALQSSDPGVVGVVAQLGTIEDDALSRLLAVSCRSQLGTLVIRDTDTRQRLLAILQDQRYPIPDMLPLSVVLPYKGATKRLDASEYRGMGPRAQELFRAACAGSDPPLGIPLPHVAAMSRMKEDNVAQLAGQGPGLSDWPAGCCGFAVNLVRPVVRGHRALVLYNVVGNVLVFETLAEATAYREFVAQKLKAQTYDIVTLDGQKLSGRGIISGSSSFQVPASRDQLDYCFGSSGAAGNNLEAAEALAQAAAMEKWVELLRACTAADAEVAEAQAQADDVASMYSGELQQVEADLADLDAQLAPADVATDRTGAGSSAGKKRGRHQQQQQQQGSEEDAGSRQPGSRRRRR